MKKIIILTLVVLMCGIVQAHDPNSLPDNKAWQMSMNEKNILTLDVRLSLKYVMVLSKLTRAEITVTIERMVKSWETLFRRNWFKRQKTEDMN